MIGYYQVPGANSFVRESCFNFQYITISTHLDEKNGDIIRNLTNF